MTGDVDHPKGQGASSSGTGLNENEDDYMVVSKPNSKNGPKPNAD